MTLGWIHAVLYYTCLLRTDKRLDNGWTAITSKFTEEYYLFPMRTSQRDSHCFRMPSCAYPKLHQQRSRFLDVSHGFRGFLTSKDRFSNQSRRKKEMKRSLRWALRHFQSPASSKYFLSLILPDYFRSFEYTAGGNGPIWPIPRLRIRAVLQPGVGEQGPYSVPSVTVFAYLHP